MKKLMTLIGVLGFSFSVQAAEVDATASQFKWTGKKVTGQHYGTLPIKSSKVKVDKGKVSSGEFVLDITKLTVDDLKGEYKTKFLTHMKSKDFFNVEKWATAKLVITKLDGKVAHGELTIKDKTNKVKIPYTQKNNVFSGQLKFDRTKYGMIYGSGDFFKGLGDKMIYNDVTLDFKVTVKGLKNKLAQK